VHVDAVIRPGEHARSRLLAVVRYGFALFVSALLVFQVQPLAGRFILPWFGGGSAVWTSCLLFFQMVLLGGYAYAHWLSEYVPPRRQAWIHMSLLGICLAFLPIAPEASWKPPDPSFPALRILALLGASLGPPLLLACATAPLLQRWFHREVGGDFPYRLYAVSNAGSLVGLLSYPFLLEPWLGLKAQSALWSVGFTIFAAASGWCAWSLHRGLAQEETEDTAASEAVGAPAPSRQRRLLWLALSACGSVLLVATTARITQDVAPIPLLWVLPLALYLVSFIACFGNERGYDRRIWGPLFVVGLAGLTGMLLEGKYVDIRIQVAVYCGALFASCMVCHGEMVRLRPNPRHLTAFYLIVSAGGALGGIFVGLVAPMVFADYWELHLACLAAFALFAGLLLRDHANASGRWAVALPLGLGLIGALLLFGLARDYREQNEGRLAVSRGFYGVLSVRDRNLDTPHPVRRLMHGRIEHGAQPIMGKHWGIPASYYGSSSGVAVAIQRHPRASSGGDGRDADGLSIGAVGLGVGTIAAYARPQDRLRFYEIDPAMREISNAWFSYRSRSRARQELVLGDARVSMERELAEGRAQGFDVLVLDAFTGDAVPVHLLTREAFDVYRRHLAPGGILAVHISAIHLDLSPVVRGLAKVAGMRAVRIEDAGDVLGYATWSDWILVTNNEAFLEDPAVRVRVTPWSDAAGTPRVWTDDFSNLAQVVK